MTLSVVKTHKFNLLYIDDEKHNLTAFRHAFSDEYEVFTALSASEAYKIVKANDIQLIVSDQRMPEETGVEFLTRIRREYPNTIRTILTGYSDMDAVVDAINKSAIYYFFEKPWDEEKLKLVFRNALEALVLSSENSLLIRDLTIALEELRRKSSELEEQSEQRLELIEKLERANKVKGEFLSVISHELRTPLNPIIGYSDLLMQEPDASRTKEIVAVIHDCSMNLLELIDGILQFMSADQTTAEGAKESFSMKLFLREIHMLAESLVAEKEGIVVKTHMLVDGVITADRPDLHGEHVVIRQILHNLVSNACKFTEKGEISISAELSGTSKNHRLKITVTDTGIGIDESNFESIFETFTQVDQSLNRKFDGIGLGLALSRRQARTLGGMLSVSSEIGKGSVFVFELPIRKKSDVESEVIKDLPEFSLKVLVVDNNEKSSFVLDTMLKVLSCDSTSVRNGSDAIAAIESSKYDIVFIDLYLPRMNGVRLTDLIGDMELNYSPRLIAVTADLTVESRKHALAEEIDRVLYKPVHFDKLTEFLTEFQD